MEYVPTGSCFELVSFSFNPLIGSIKKKKKKKKKMQSGPFEESYVAIIIREALKGLQLLHENGFLHRDVKGWINSTSI